MDIRAYSNFETKAVDDDRRLIRGMATTPTVDRMGDVVDPMGVKVARDIPLFLHHDSRLIVGRASLSKPTAKGIEFEASLPNVTELGALRDRVDEAWQLIKYGLVKAVSIGFRVLDDAYERIEKTGGLKFLSTEVMELSLVPIPANPQAVIAEAKAYDASRADLLNRIDRIQRSPTGLAARPPGVSGTSGIALPGGAFRLIPRTYGKTS